LEAAAGNASVADATVASTEADLDTQLASALTDKAVTALNTIMDMQA
jgi:flagellar hook-basal body complex protein FliE